MSPRISKKGKESALRKSCGDKNHNQQIVFRTLEKIFESHMRITKRDNLVVPVTQQAR